MADQSATTGDIKEVLDEVERLAQTVNNAFTHQQEQLNEIKATQAEHTERFDEVQKVQAQHTDRLEDLANGEAQLVKKVDAVTDYHDQEIHRVLKHLKLKPLKASE